MASVDSVPGGARIDGQPALVVVRLVLVVLTMLGRRIDQAEYERPARRRGLREITEIDLAQALRDAAFHLRVAQGGRFALYAVHFAFGVELPGKARRSAQAGVDEETAPQIRLVAAQALHDVAGGERHRVLVLRLGRRFFRGRAFRRSRGWRRAAACDHSKSEC
jgi:hypothetical protein